MTRKRLIIGSGLALGLAAFIATGLVITSGQFVPPQPPSGGSTTIQVLTDPGNSWNWTTDFSGASDYSSCVQAGNFFDYGTTTTAITCARGTDTTALGWLSRTGTNASTGMLNSHGNYSTQPYLQLGGYTFDIKCRVRFPTLDNGTNSYIDRGGFGSWTSATAKPANGVYVQYDHSTDGDHFALVTQTASVEARSVCTVAITANTWYTWEMIVGPVTTELKVNGTSCGTLSTVTGVAMGMSIQFQKTTTGAAVGSDYNWCQGYASVNRS